MAFPFTNNLSKAHLLFLIIFYSLEHFTTVTSFEFEVLGVTNGWTVPPSNDTNIFNKWASKNRFQIGDSIHFKYGKDSVMLITLPEYKQCNSTHPLYFANNGNTEFKFDRSGLFYFISGVAGHCERGQKMIVRVMAPEEDPPASSSSVVKSSVFTIEGAVLPVELFVFEYEISLSQYAVKSSWPELFGVDGHFAVWIIETENPNVNVIMVPEWSFVATNEKYDMVRVWVNTEGNVSRVPRIG